MINCPSQRKKASIAPVFIATDGEIQSYNSDLQFRFFNPNATTVTLQCPLQDSVIVLAGIDQTFTGNVIFTEPVTGVTPVNSNHLATKAYVDSVAGGGVSDEYIVKNSVTANTTGPDVIAAIVNIPAGTYSVELKAIMSDGVSNASLYQNFVVTVGVFSATGDNSQFNGTPAFFDATFNITSAMTGINILVGGISAGWKVVYKIMQL